MPPPLAFSPVQILSDFPVLIHSDISKMPKLTRYTLGTELLDQNYSIIRLIILALKKSGKSRLLILEKADVELEVLRITLRLISQTRGISERRYIFLSEKLISIGKQLGGFIKDEKNPPQPLPTGRQAPT